MGFWEGRRVAGQGEEIEWDERISRDSDKVVPEVNCLAQGVLNG